MKPDGRSLATRLWLPVTLATAGAMAWITYRRWCHPYIDFGRELYTPWQMVVGRALYRELAYLNGPLSPAFNALVFRLLGVSLTAVLVADGAVLVAILLLLRGLLRRIADAWSVLLASVVFVLAFAFNQSNTMGNYNYMCPYSHEMTHGLLLGLTSLYALSRFLENRAWQWGAAAGFALGLTLLTKPEPFLATLAVCVAGMCIDFRSRTAWRVPSGRPWLTLWTASGLAPTLAWLVLALAMPPGDAAVAMLTALRSIVDPRLGNLPFYRAVMGVDDVAWSLASLGAGCVMGLMIVAVAAAVANGTSRIHGRRARLAAAAAACLLISALLAALAGVAVWRVAARALPLAMLGLFLTAAFRTARERTDPGRWRHDATCTLAAVFALVLMAKIVFNAGPHHYGFALAAPAAMLATAAAFEWIPRAMRLQAVAFSAFRGVILGAAPVAALSFARKTFDFANARQVPIGVGDDLLLAEPEPATMINGLLDVITRETRPADSLAVLPEGTLLNFLARRPNPTPFTSVMPPELIIFGEDKVVAAFQAAPPDMVALLPFDMSEYGYDAFGKGYAPTLWAWLAGAYETVAVMPPMDEQEQAVLLRRRRG